MYHFHFCYDYIKHVSEVAAIGEHGLLYLKRTYLTEQWEETHIPIESVTGVCISQGLKSSHLIGGAILIIVGLAAFGFASMVQIQGVLFAKGLVFICWGGYVIATASRLKIEFHTYEGPVTAWPKEEDCDWDQARNVVNDLCVRRGIPISVEC